MDDTTNSKKKSSKYIKYNNKISNVSNIKNGQ